MNEIYEDMILIKKFSLGYERIIIRIFICSVIFLFYFIFISP